MVDEYLAADPSERGTLGRIIAEYDCNCWPIFTNWRLGVLRATMSSVAFKIFFCRGGWPPRRSA